MRGLSGLSTVQKITHVVFDLDGVLLDSEGVFAKVFADTLAFYGKKYTENIHANVSGKKRLPGMETAINMSGLAGKVTLKEFDAKYEEFTGYQLRNCSPTPGAIRLVEHLATKQIPISICTSTEHGEFALKMAHLKQLTAAVRFVVLGDDPEIREGKPAPDPYLVAMKRFSPPPADSKNVLVFEDSPSGVRSALAAGTTVYMIEDPRLSTPEIRSLRKDVACVLKSLAEFKPETVGLPPY